MTDYTTTYFDEEGSEYTLLWRSGSKRYSDDGGDFGPDEIFLIVAHKDDGTLVSQKSDLWDELEDSWDDAQPIAMDYDKFGNLL